MPLVLHGISHEPLSLEAHLEAVNNARAGAVATFIGTVRDHDPEMTGQVVGLDYTCHPDAAAYLERVVNSVLSELDPKNDAVVAVTHRVGELRVGDIAIIAAVATSHRGLAFDLCERIVDDVKHNVPIWKHQHTADGSSAWSGIQ